MRILVTIPHYAGNEPSSDGRRHSSTSGPSSRRVAALTACLAALHQNFGPVQGIMEPVRRTAQPLPRNRSTTLDVILCTTGERHVLAELPSRQFEHCLTHAEPMLLGFECHRVLRDRIGSYDYYGYLEDDLVLEDPWFFTKLAWFCGHVGNDKLLQPNRFEAGPHEFMQKAYLDGDLAPGVTARFQQLADTPRLESEVLGRQVVFHRPLNPHSGCFFLNAEQMRHWSQQPSFLSRDCSFVGPLESAATLSIMQTFKVYKPALENADFLELRHFGQEYLQMIRRA